MLQPFDLFQTRKSRQGKRKGEHGPEACPVRLGNDLGLNATPPQSQIPITPDQQRGAQVSQSFIFKLNPLTTKLQTLLIDFRVIFERDPAARNWIEVLCCYPGLHAIFCHRVAHWLHSRGVAFIPRLISYLGRFLTGIEIHPAAVIGQGVFIDHGTGVVIGETAIVGNYTLIYQGAVLGGTGKESGKRHPTLGENVVVGAGAKVLGNIHIGDHVRIGAGSVVLRDVPSECTVVGVPGRNICRSNERVCPLEHGNLPDAEAAVISALAERLDRLEQQLQTLQRSHGNKDVYTL